MEGTRLSVPCIGDLARRDIPTCRLDDRIGEVGGRVRAAGWDLCAVVTDRNISLSRLRQAQLGGDPGLSAPEAMEEGTATYRPNRQAAETATYLPEHTVPSLLVTTGDGELIGPVCRDDFKSAAI
jgi:hypothetical protein